MKRFCWIALVMLMALCLVACGGKGAEAPAASNPMNDALALLPGNAIGLGTVDARTVFANPTFGSDLAALVERLVPIGPEAGFQASRDVDRVTFGSYSYQGVDVAAIVIGRFDETKIKQAVSNHASTSSGSGAGLGTGSMAGSMIVVSQYAGRDIYTVNNVGFTLLSNTMALAGTESGMRRVLERIQDGRVRRDVAPWMIETVETQGAAFAAVGDFTTTPMPADVTRQIPLAFMQNLKAARVVGSFKNQGVELAGSMSYPDAQAAQAASKSVQQVLGSRLLFAIAGIKMRSVDVKVEASDVQVVLDVGDSSLRQLLVLAPQWFGR
ncbi:MAG: hypothetical protein FWD73_06495 [Polyangiaceae bacterium]|nr:hypothetical protein [Polyangiaceae bacterium]